jgi:membrane-bound serine protease (ClpP class)
MFGAREWAPGLCLCSLAGVTSDWLMDEALTNLSRVFRMSVALLTTLFVFVTIGASSAAAHTGHQHSRVIKIIEVSGLLDPVEIDYIDAQLQDAQRNWALAIVFQINSPGAAADEDKILELLENIDGALVPVGVWIGQSGATAKGAAAHLVAVADYSGIAPGSRIGQFGDLPNPRITEKEAEGDRLERGQDAVDAGLVDVMAPTLGDFLLAMEDIGVVEEISTEVEQADGLVRRAIADDVTVTFSKLSLLDQQFHTVASPAVAYLLLLVGLSLLLLDFFTGGIGVAGGVGAVSLLLACYGLGVLEIRPWGLIALVVSMIAFGVDLQTGFPRFWTIAGSVLLVLGSLRLFVSHSVSWLTLAGGIGLTLAFVLSGMPALIRTRYGTSTLGRDWMIGEMAVAATDLAPEGTVVFQNAQWRAKVNRLTPIKEGDAARIVGLEGLVLAVEPEEGGAIDYREMRQRRPDASGSEESDAAEPSPEKGS